MVEIFRQKDGYRLTSEVRLPAHIYDVFEFFSDATQLEKLTPEWLNFSILTPTPIAMREGTLIDYKLRIHAFPIKWQTRITRWEPPFRFADEQLKGPYRRWYHLHTFEPSGNDTICRDQVDYDFIGGPLIHTLFVKRDLQKIFAFRTRILQEIFTPQTIHAPAKLVSI